MLKLKDVQYKHDEEDKPKIIITIFDNGKETTKKYRKTFHKSIKCEVVSHNVTSCNFSETNIVHHTAQDIYNIVQSIINDESDYPWSMKIEYVNTNELKMKLEYYLHTNIVGGLLIERSTINLIF